MVKNKELMDSVQSVLGESGLGSMHYYFGIVPYVCEM